MTFATGTSDGVPSGLMGCDGPEFSPGDEGSVAGASGGGGNESVAGINPSSDDEDFPFPFDFDDFLRCIVALRDLDWLLDPRLDDLLLDLLDRLNAPNRLE